MLVALAGGIGAARLLSGLVGVADPAEIVAVVNTGDDFVMHGLHISPDIDTVVYTLAGISSPERGWGLANESWRVMESLERLGGQTWFSLGDRDLATHLYRTTRLAEGARLSDVTGELAARWGLALRVLPMSDDPVVTRLTLREQPEREIGFQDYFVRLAHNVPVKSIRFAGAVQARPAPGVIEALERAERLIICPSNPLLSISPILAIDEIREVLRRRRHDVIAVSPIVAGVALKGPADRLLRELGHEPSAVGVARCYADIAETLVIDEVDAELAPRVVRQGLECIVAPTIMSTRERARALARFLVPADSAS